MVYGRLPRARILGCRTNCAWLKMPARCSASGKVVHTLQDGGHTFGGGLHVPCSLCMPSVLHTCTNAHEQHCSSVAGVAQDQAAEQQLSALSNLACGFDSVCVCVGVWACSMCSCARC